MTYSMGLTAAWYAAAPPPPPVPVETFYQDYGQQIFRHRTNSSIDSQMIPPSSSNSSSIGFDARAKGDDLPIDSHAPEPERPVSRNALAKVRERERLRARTNSTSTYSSTGTPPSRTIQRQQTADPILQNMSQFTIRERHDSSPAAASPFSMYKAQEPPYTQSMTGQVIISSMNMAGAGHEKAPYWTQQRFEVPHGINCTSLPPSPVKSSWSPISSSSPATSFMQPSFYSAPSSAHAPQIASWSAASSPITPGYSSTVPFPIDQSMAPPSILASQIHSHRQHRHQHSNSSRPLPSPSRSSSQCSSVGTGSNSPSTMSLSSGTVRKSLPQPPIAPLIALMEKTDLVDNQRTIGRHDSVRMAAEAIMARGLPRRKHVSAGSKSTVISSSVANMEPILDNSNNKIKQQKTSPVRLARAESADCLQKEMRDMELLQERSQSPKTKLLASNVDLPTGELRRAASPRPIRAAPKPAPAVSIEVPMEEIVQSRPQSRGPKDERERRKSSTGIDSLASSKQISMIFSPPPDAKPSIPNFSFDVADSTVSSKNMPGIVSTGEEVLSSNDTRLIQSPSISIDAPAINISSNDSVEEEEEKFKPSISISVSSSSVAQRSITTSKPLNRRLHQCPNDINHDIHRQVAPASASSVGSGASCATCQKWIGGRVVHAMNLTFHPDCFICCHCSEQLEHVAFYEHEGRPYCHFDYHEIFSKRCFHCRTPIVDQRYITINDMDLVGAKAEERCYHDLHFFCANCGDPFMDPKVASSAAGSNSMDIVEDEEGKVRFGGREFVVHKGYPYCERCHVSLHKSKCKGCKLPIVETEYLTALKAKWHLNCFCCQRCESPIKSDDFFVQDGKAYDEECYKIKLRSEL